MQADSGHFIGAQSLFLIKRMDVLEVCVLYLKLAYYGTTIGKRTPDALAENATNNLLGWRHFGI